MPKKICNVCNFQQDEFLKIGGKNYCNSCASLINNDGGGKILGSITVSAYESQATYDLLYDSLEWLELYVERANPSWRGKKQLPKTITRPDIDSIGSTRMRSMFSTSLSALRNLTISKPPFFLEKLQEEFYKWLDGSKIDVGNCSNELAQCLINTFEILRGKGDEFYKARREEVRKNIENMSKEERAANFNEIVLAYQEPLENEEKKAKSMEGQTYKNVNNESRFSGDADRGKEIFEQIKKRQENPQQRTNSEIIQDVVRNKNRVWRIDDVIIYQDGVKCLAKALIKNSVQLEYDETGYPLFNSENMYQESKFNEEEKVLINQALGISQTPTSTNNYQQNQSVDKSVSNSATPNSNNSSLGTVAIIGSVLALLSLGIYGGIVKKSKKVKKSR